MSKRERYKLGTYECNKDQRASLRFTTFHKEEILKRYMSIQHYFDVKIKREFGTERRPSKKVRDEQGIQ